MGNAVSSPIIMVCLIPDLSSDGGAWGDGIDYRVHGCKVAKARAVAPACDAGMTQVQTGKLLQVTCQLACDYQLLKVALPQSKLACFDQFKTCTFSIKNHNQVLMSVVLQGGQL